ncbi:MAG: choice-of-anchor D domain-containing protein, partial [Candidatus Aminicenantes bacterium]|nr:choice-of-anchor D domain-containing protein [Candidatus Aminicenantes bacterium]
CPDIRQPISAINFGDVVVGSSSSQTTTIYNDGDGTLTVNSIVPISGSTNFSYEDPIIPFTVTAGGSRDVTVKFTPSSTGAKSAVFNVNSDDPDEPDVTFDVSGTGIVAAESVSAPSTLAGQTNGYLNTSYTYTTGGATSSFGHEVQYYFDWGDGTNTGWLSVGTLSAQKSWSSANTYTVKAKARCAIHTSIESPWSASLYVTISAQEFGNSPSRYQVIPECIWAVASGGGTWVSEVQITDITGGSVVSVYFDYGGGNRRGPFTLWTGPAANYNVKYSNILSSIDAIDAGAFTYYGRVGAVEFSTQDTAHKIQVTARTLNGNYSKTFPGLNLTDANTANTSRRMMIQNFVNNATYRSTCGFFNPTADSVTIEIRLVAENGNTIGSAFSRTLVGHDFQSFSPFNQAGVPYPSYSYDNVVLWVTPTSGSGKVLVFGASANNTSNDPAAHIGAQYQ